MRIVPFLQFSLEERRSLHVLDVMGLNLIDRWTPPSREEEERLAARFGKELATDEVAVTFGDKLRRLARRRLRSVVGDSVRGPGTDDEDEDPEGHGGPCVSMEHLIELGQFIIMALEVAQRESSEDYWRSFVPDGEEREQDEAMIRVLVETRTMFAEKLQEADRLVSRAVGKLGVAESGGMQQALAKLGL